MGSCEVPLRGGGSYTEGRVRVGRKERKSEAGGMQWMWFL